PRLPLRGQPGCCVQSLARARSADFRMDVRTLPGAQVRAARPRGPANSPLEADRGRRAAAPLGAVRSHGALSGRALALAQGLGRGGFGPSSEMQAAAKAQTESATSQMHAYLNDIAYRMLAERAKRVAVIETKEQAVARRDEVRRRIVE